MINIHELLEDPIYKAYFLEQPKVPWAKKPTMTKPWRLYVMLKGTKTWRRKEFDTYADAFKYLRTLMKQGRISDAAIHCKRYAFDPPTRLAKIRGKFKIGSDGKKRQVVKEVRWRERLHVDEIETHTWCPYCRRPTVFKYYTKHHALKSLGGIVDSSVRRCCICGISERMLKEPIR